MNVRAPGPTRGGWQPAGNLASLIRDQLSAEEESMLAALMAVDVPGQEQLEFLR